MPSLISADPAAPVTGPFSVSDDCDPTATTRGPTSWATEPVFTPTTKATAGHDEFMTFEDVVAAIGPDTAAELKRITLAVYQRGAEIAAERGIVIADTKLEFGLDSSGTLTLADEVLTPDSSRFWAAAEWQPGVQCEDAREIPGRGHRHPRRLVSFSLAVASS